MRFYITLFALTLLASISHGQNLIVNGDFEADTFTVWPGYTGGENPESISGWTRNEVVSPGNVGINPVFEPQNPSSIIGWTRNEDSVSNIGINPVADGRQPFADNGDSDGGILFMQGESSVFQEVSGLTVGEDYVLSVDYNARNCCGDIPAVTLELNGQFSDQFPDPDDFIDALVDPVEVGAWWFTEIPFTAESEDLRVEFFTFPDLGGDATFLLDNIALELESGGDNLLINGDFEAELDQWVTWPGYLGVENAGPRAPFRDNGNNDTKVALLQNSAAIDQEITGLTIGEEYTLSLEYNARNCCGAVPEPQLFIDGEPIIEFADDAGFVEPVGGENDWYAFETTIVAEATSFVLTVQNDSDIEGGDSTFLVDNVFFGQMGMIFGDFDNNGSVTPEDINILAATEGTSVEDITSTLAQLGFLNGDLDLDGEVAFSDFLVLSNNFGQPDLATWVDGDLDGDKKVAFSDFLILSNNFGGTAAQPISVPEPESLLTVMFGLLGLSLARKMRINANC